MGAIVIGDTLLQNEKGPDGLRAVPLKIERSVIDTVDSDLLSVTVSFACIAIDFAAQDGFGANRVDITTFVDPEEATSQIVVALTAPNRRKDALMYSPEQIQWMKDVRARYPDFRFGSMALAQIVGEEVRSFRRRCRPHGVSFNLETYYDPRQQQSEGCREGRPNAS